MPQEQKRTYGAIVVKGAGKKSPELREIFTAEATNPETGLALIHGDAQKHGWKVEGPALRVSGPGSQNLGLRREQPAQLRSPTAVDVEDSMRKNRK